MTTMEEIRSALHPVEAEVRVCLNGKLFREEKRIKAELEQYEDWAASSLSDTDPRKPLQKKLAAVYAQMRKEEKLFIFKSIGDKASSDLLVQHPSPKDDKGEDRYAFDPSSYPVALVAASSLDPVLTIEDAEFIFEGTNLDGRNKLFNTAYEANNRSISIPFSLPASEPAGSTEAK